MEFIVQRHLNSSDGDLKTRHKQPRLAPKSTYTCVVDSSHCSRKEHYTETVLVIDWLTFVNRLVEDFLDSWKIKIRKGIVS